MISPELQRYEYACHYKEAGMLYHRD